MTDVGGGGTGGLGDERYLEEAGGTERAVAKVEVLERESTTWLHC